MDKGVKKDKGINVTYETLFEFLVREKNRAELQKLEPQFFNNLVEYLKEKQSILNREHLDVFSEEEKEKTGQQLRNIKRVIKELYERREKKILNIALIKSRTGSDVIDTSALMEEEKRFFESVVATLDTYRNDILFNLVNAKHPVMNKPAENMEKSEKAAMPVAAQPETKKEVRDTKTVRFISAVPKFLGKELEVYGPFEEEDVASLPGDVADVLISKGRAEEIDA